MNRWEKVGIIIIMLIGAFLRLYKISAYQTFLGDEGRDAIVMRDIMQARHFPLIGPGTSIGNMYLGPLYYYLSAPSLALAGFSPVGPAIEVALFGLATIALLWWIGRDWFGPFPSLAAALLYALSPTVIIYSRSSWNPNIMPFFSLLCLYGLWLVWSKHKWRWLIVSAVSLAMVLNSHYLGLLLIPVLGLFWLISFLRQKQSRPLAIKASAVSLIIFIGLMSPLFFFDLRHNWQNTTAIKTFFTNRQTTVNLKFYKALPLLWPVGKDIVTSLMTAKQPQPGFYLTIFLLLSSLLMLFIRRSRGLIFLVIWFGVGLTGLGLYKQHIYDHYYGFLFPAVFLLFGFTLQFFFRNTFTRILALSLVAYLIFINLQSSPLRYPPNNQVSHTREIADFIINQSASQPFNLALIAKSNYDASYRYFLQLKSAPNLTIHQSITDQLFVICEDRECHPIGHPLWEIASFGWAKIDANWDFPWGVKLYRLVHNPQGI